MTDSSYLKSISILLEALPYIRRFRDTIIVIKFGGAAMESQELRKNFARDIVLLQYVGIKPIIVHGGGPQISQALNEFSITSEFVDGHRVTSEASMDVVEMVLSGKINKEIVAIINQEGGKSVGISGRDGKLAYASTYTLEKTNPNGEKESLALGRVGRVKSQDITPALLHTLEGGGYLPVIAPIATDTDGNALNINGDTMAGSIAIAMNAKKLILLTDTPGVIINGKVQGRIHPEEIQELKRKKSITGGMIPKVDCCVDAIRAGVEQAHILDGREPHSLLLEIFTAKGIGTMICTQG